MNLFRLALPTVLLLYFVVKATHTRIFLLGIPFLMFISRAVFFEKMKPFWMPSRLAPVDLVMIWLLIVWVVYRDVLLPPHERPLRIAKPSRSRLFGWEETILVLVGLLTLTNVFVTASRYGDFVSALGQSRGVFYLLLGYVLVRDMFSRATAREINEFIGAIVIVNTIAAVLFIAHQGLHIQIYDVTEYQVFTFMGQRLTRSFYFMPPLLLLGVAYAFAQRTLGIRWTVVAIVTVVALWVSYTRSLLIIAVLEAVAVIGLRLFLGHEALAMLKRTATVLVAAVIMGAAVYVVLPVQTQYFFSRFSQATSSGITGDQNLVSRSSDMRIVYRFVGGQDAVLGAGFPSAAQQFEVRTVDGLSSDIVWVPVFYRLGIAGIVLIVLLSLVNTTRGLKLGRSQDDDLQVLGLALAVFVFGTLVQGFVSWTFMDPDRFPMGFWALAVISALTVVQRGMREEVGNVV